MIARTVLVTLFAAQSIFATSSVAFGNESSQQNRCECLVQAPMDNGPVGLVEVTGGEVLSMSNFGYLPVAPNTSATVFGDTVVMVGPRSEGNVVFANGCSISLSGQQEIGVRSTGDGAKALCAYSVNQIDSLDTVLDSEIDGGTYATRGFDGHGGISRFGERGGISRSGEHGGFRGIGGHRGGGFGGPGSGFWHVSDHRPYPTGSFGVGYRSCKASR